MLYRPRFGEANMGAVAGAAVAAIGGLFAVGIGPAIIERSISALFAVPKVSLLCWLASAPVGWVLGGQVGPYLGQAFRSPRVEVVAGAISGLIPVVLIGFWGWHMWTTY